MLVLCKIDDDSRISGFRRQRIELLGGLSHEKKSARCAPYRQDEDHPFVDGGVDVIVRPWHQSFSDDSGVLRRVDRADVWIASDRLERFREFVVEEIRRVLPVRAPP